MTRFVLLFVVLVLIYSTFAAKTTQVWMCLNICDSNATIDNQLRVIEKVAPRALTSISFEKYTLSPDARLVDFKGLKPVNDILSKIQGVRGKLERFPMITSYPYPPEFITFMRKLFANPMPFIEDAIREAKLYGYKGYNLDFEPHHNVTPDDAKAYVKFVDLFASALQSNGFELQVDIAAWGNLWPDWRSLAKTRVNTFCTMNTYTGTKDTWLKAFQRGLNELGISKFGCGLMTTHSQENRPLNKEEIDLRFNEIIKAKVQTVSVWRMDGNMNEQSYWWTQFENFLKS